MSCYSLLALLLICLILLTSACSASEYRSLTILFTNDIHDNLLPFSYPDPPNDNLGYSKMPFIKDIGGLARIATLGKRVKAETHGNALLVDVGDLLEGGFFTIEYDGEADFAVLSTAGYDAMTFGNHEFTTTIAQLKHNIGIATFPIVCANVVDKQTRELIVPPYKILDIQGLKVAVLGVTTHEGISEVKAVKEGLDPLNPIETAKKYVPTLRDQADIIIVLDHEHPPQNKELVQALPDIDVILGGHAHARQETPILLDTGQKPAAFSVGGTVFGYTYQSGGEVGRIDLRLRKNGERFEIMSFKGSLIPVNSEIPDDPETAKVIDKYYKPIAKYYNEVLGEAADTFYNNRAGENTSLYLIADSMREIAGTQIAMYGEFGCRGDLLKGPIKMTDINAISPYKVKMVTLEMTGARLKKAIQTFVPGVSGMRYKVASVIATEGPRNGKAVGKWVDGSVDGKPIDDNAIYTVVTHQYIVQLYFQDIANPKILDMDCRTAVAEYIKRHKVISPVADGRRDASRDIINN